MWPHWYHYNETASHVSMGLGTGFKPQGRCPLICAKTAVKALQEFRRVSPTIQTHGVHKLSRWGSGLALILFGMWISGILAKS
jgi:hypothetical protein